MLKVKTIALLLVAVAAGVGLVAPGRTVAAPDVNPTVWDCVGTDNYDTIRYFGLTPPEVVQLINTDADPSYQVDGVRGLITAYRKDGLVTYSLALDGYTGFCFPHGSGG